MDKGLKKLTIKITVNIGHSGNFNIGALVSLKYQENCFKATVSCTLIKVAYIPTHSSLSLLQLS